MFWGQEERRALETLPSLTCPTTHTNLDASGLSAQALEIGEGLHAPGRPVSLLTGHTEAGVLLTQIKATQEHSKTKPPIASWLAAQRALWPLLIHVVWRWSRALLSRYVFTRKTVSSKTPMCFSSYWETRESRCSGPFQSRGSFWLPGVCVHTPKGIAKPTEWIAPRLLLFPYEKHMAGYTFYYGGMATYGTKSHSVDNFRTLICIF